MGIRESFEHHPKEAGDLNIRDLSIEEKKREEELFDFDAEITDSDWQLIKSRFNPNVLGVKDLRYIVALKIAFPKHFKEFEIDDKLFDKLKANFDNEIEDHPRYIDSYECAMNMKLLFPGKEPIITLDEKCWQEIEDDLKKNKSNIFAVASIARKARLLFPKKDLSKIIDDELWEEMKIALLQSSTDKIQWINFHHLARNMKILRPKQSEELGVNTEKLKEMREWLEKLYTQARHGYGFDYEWEKFISLAMSIKILAADEVKVTDQGIECVMRQPEDFKKEKKPRPERRQF